MVQLHIGALTLRLAPSAFSELRATFERAVEQQAALSGDPTIAGNEELANSSGSGGSRHVH